MRSSQNGTVVKFLSSLKMGSFSSREDRYDGSWRWIYDCYDMKIHEKINNLMKDDLLVKRVSREIFEDLRNLVGGFIISSSDLPYLPKDLLGIVNDYFDALPYDLIIFLMLLVSERSFNLCLTHFQKFLINKNLFGSNVFGYRDLEHFFLNYLRNRKRVFAVTCLCFGYDKYMIKGHPRETVRISWFCFQDLILKSKNPEVDKKLLDNLRACGRFMGRLDDLVSGEMSYVISRHELGGLPNAEVIVSKSLYNIMENEPSFLLKILRRNRYIGFVRNERVNTRIGPITYYILRILV